MSCRARGEALSILNNRFFSETLVSAEIGKHRLRLYEGAAAGFNRCLNLFFGLLKVLQRDQTPRHPDSRFRRRPQRKGLLVFLYRVFVASFIAKRLALLKVRRCFVGRLLLSYFQGTAAAGGDDYGTCPISVANCSYSDRERTCHHVLEIKLSLVVCRSVSNLVYEYD
jgi:hypothetical protein